VPAPARDAGGRLTRIVRDNPLLRAYDRRIARALAACCTEEAIMRPPLGITLTGLATLAITTPPAVAAPDVDPLQVASIAYGGSGCPQGSVRSSLFDDGTRFALIFDQYVVATGEDIAGAESRKTCQLNIHLRLPPVAGASCVKLEYRGYASLAGATRSISSATYYWLGSFLQGPTELTFYGAIVRDYRRDDAIMLPYLASSQRMIVSLDVESDIRLDTRSALPSQIRNDTIDGSIHACTRDDCTNGSWEQYRFRTEGECLRFLDAGEGSR
jgi:hypothetical protein